jgi:hypothetical protein
VSEYVAETAASERALGRLTRWNVRLWWVAVVVCSVVSAMGLIEFFGASGTQPQNANEGAVLGGRFPDSELFGLVGLLLMARAYGRLMRSGLTDAQATRSMVMLFRVATVVAAGSFVVMAHGQVLYLQNLVCEIMSLHIFLLVVCLGLSGGVLVWALRRPNGSAEQA